MVEIKFKVLGVQLYGGGFERLLSQLTDWLSEKRCGYCCFVSVHSLIEAVDHPEMKNILNHSISSNPDGMPLAWLGRLKLGRTCERISGPDFMDAVLKKYPHIEYGFIGSSSEIIQKIISRYGLKNVKMYSPPFRSYSPQNALDDWNEYLRNGGEKSQIIWVGLGAPKQEKWMADVSKVAKNQIFMGVGAAFDFLSGNKSRPPKWVQRLGFEWCHRLFSEPRRLGLRYLVTNTKFVLYLIMERAGVKIDR